MKAIVSFPDGDRREAHVIAGGKGSAVIMTSFGTFHSDGGGIYRWLGCRSVTAQMMSQAEAKKTMHPHTPRYKESFKPKKQRGYSLGHPIC